MSKNKNRAKMSEAQASTRESVLSTLKEEAEAAEPVSSEEAPSAIVVTDAPPAAAPQPTNPDEVKAAIESPEGETALLNIIVGQPDDGLKAVSDGFVENPIHPQEPLPAPVKPPMPVVDDHPEPTIAAYDEEIGELGAKRDGLQNRINVLQNRRDNLQLHLSGEKGSPRATQKNIMEYLAGQKKVREDRAARSQHFRAAGFTVQDLTAKSPIDQAHQRTQARGSARPAQTPAES